MKIKFAIKNFNLDRGPEDGRPYWLRGDYVSHPTGDTSMDIEDAMMFETSEEADAAVESFETKFCGEGVSIAPRYSVVEVGILYTELHDE